MTISMRTRLLLIALLGFGSFLAEAQAPTPTIQASSAIVCSGQTVTYTAKQGSLVPVSMGWTVSPNTGLSFPTTASDSILIVNFANAGRYVIAFSWSFDISGSATKTMAVNVTKSAVSAFNASLTGYGFPNELVLKDFSSNSNKIYWVFDLDFQVKDSSAQYTKSYQNAGTYTVSHIALGSQGCNDTTAYTFVLAESSSMTLPNVFTPNHDGANDVFRPICKGISELHVMVHNRLGILVYEWNTVNGFWDGYSISGVACDEGTYYVIAEGKGFDNKSFSLRGSLSLLR